MTRLATGVAAVTISAILLLMPVTAAATTDPVGLCASTIETTGSPDDSDSSDGQPASFLVDQSAIDDLVDQYKGGDSIGSREAASALFAQGRALTGSNVAEAELRMRAAAALDPERTDISAAIIALHAAPTPPSDGTFQDALELLRCSDAGVQIEGVELAIAIAKSNSVPIPGVVIAEYPSDELAYLDADRLLAAGRDEQARELAKRIAESQTQEAAAIPERFHRSRWERLVEDRATTILEGGARLVGVLATAGFAAWVVAQLVKKAWRHRWLHRDVQVALGDFTDGSQIDGAVAAAKAVVTRELQFAAGRSTSLDAITGAGASLSTVELPSQLKILGPLLDWARRGPRYSLVVHLHRVSQTTLAVLGEIQTTDKKTIAAESFSEPIVTGKEIDAVDHLSIDLAGWAAFELSRLRRWPRIRKGLDDAPRLLGTERSESYRLYRQAMQSHEPDVALLEQSLAISPNNYAALLELGTKQLRDAVPESRQRLDDTSEAYTDHVGPALKHLAKALQLVHRYPTIRPRGNAWLKRRMIDLGPYAAELAEPVADADRAAIGWPQPRWRQAYRLSDHPGLVLCLYAQVDPMWFQATFRLAVGHFHAYCLLLEPVAGTPTTQPRFHAGALARGHLQASAELSVALAKAVGATHHSLIGQFGSRAASTLAIGSWGDRRALVEMTQRDGAYFASILAGILTPAADHEALVDLPGRTTQHRPVEAHHEKLLERLASSKRHLTVKQLRHEIKPYLERDYRIAYNAAAGLAQDPDCLSEVPDALEEALERMPLPVLRDRLGWFKKDPSMWQAWGSHQAEMTAVFERIEHRLASAEPNRSQPNWVEV